MNRLGLSAALLLGLLAGCAVPIVPKPPEPDKLTLTPVGFGDLPGWNSDKISAALPALRQSCVKLAAVPAERPLGVPGLGGVHGDWREPCRIAKTIGGDDGAARSFFERWFQPYRAANNANPKGLFTGYFEPELRGSKTRTARHATPLYKRPSDLVLVELGDFAEDLTGKRIAGRVTAGKLKPYEDRAALAGGSLAGKNLELAWVDDPVDAFFLHIQGSGRVILPDGKTIRVGYDGHNGHAYRPIGKDLVERGALAQDDVSLQTIRAWLKAHPSEATAMMNRNRSFIFFRELTGEGPQGAQGVALTPGRSLAVDKRFVPLGLPVWLDTTDPLDGKQPLRRLLIAQDTGGAIKGPVRGDVFWGHGPEALERAGRMKQEGGYYLLVPRPASR